MKKQTAILRFTVLLVLMFLIVPQISAARGVPRLPLDLTTNIFGSDDQSAEQVVEPETTEINNLQTPELAGVNNDQNFPEDSSEQNQNESEKFSCQFEMPEKPIYDAKFVAVRKKGVVAKGEIFETLIYVKNTGNTPWFSADSGCPYLITSLGTDKERDRTSELFTDDLLWESGWLGENRVAMESKRVDPDELAIFKFWSRAPEKDMYLREFFTPVIEGVTWLDNARFHADTRIGEGYLDLTKKDLLKYIEYSGDLSNLNVEGNKQIDVSISKQKMWLKIGDMVIREFPVSTGTTRTPTPIGTTQISHKQEVRVAGSWPHYIMPKWMTYRAGGYGIHALPSLANDNGVFWREALNHIGTRRSHGCIRLLPGDAEFAYSFADIGTTVNVYW